MAFGLFFFFSLFFFQSREGSFFSHEAWQDTSVKGWPSEARYVVPGRRLFPAPLLLFGCPPHPRKAPGRPHQITAWFGWEGTFPGHPVQPPAMGRDISNQIRVLRAPSNLAWNGSSNGASPTSLGNLGLGLTTLSINNFFLRSSINVPSSSLKPLLLVQLLQALIESLSPQWLTSGTACQ